MSNNFQQSNLGEQFKKAVSEGLSSGDFKELNILVNDTVSEVISEAGRQVKNAGSNAYRSTADIYESAKEYEEQQKKRSAQYKQQYKQYAKNDTHSGQSKKNDSVYTQSNLPAQKIKNIGQISSILYMVCGGIGIAAAVGLGITAFILTFINASLSAPFWISFGLLFCASFLLFHKGSGDRRRLNRMKRYRSLFSGKMYVNLSDLAQSTGKSTKYILKDVKKMLARGFFPEGHLDQTETCLMLDDATYREYLRLEKERTAYEKDAASATIKSTVSATGGQTVSTASSGSKQSVSDHSELMAMMREGKAYIQKLHELNDLIPGEVISEKLYRMEGLLKEIFERLEEDPSQMAQLHKLMNYYLPTTIKLLQSYADFDDISVPGADVISAKEEIEKTVDLINEAFAELLNKLFQSTVFDATADAQVLQTMLAKEGLTKNDFSKETS